MCEGRITQLRPKQYLLVLCGLFLLWPAILNGGAFLFPDTTAYVRSSDAAVLRFTGHVSAWSDADVLHAALLQKAPAPAAAVSASPVGAEAKPVLLGRSIYYGVLAYLAALTGSFWLTIILQALLAGAVVIGITRHVVDPGNDRQFALAVIGVTTALATTSLPWFTSMVMPDFLTGLAVVGAAAMIVGWTHETAGGRCLWVAVCGYAVLAHSSHILILLALALPALIVGIFALRPWRRGATVVIAVALVGLTGESAFSLGVTALTGTPPIRPPFLTARLIEDGPGLAYLDAHCRPAHFHLCRYRDRLPLNSDIFLWGSKTISGVFMAVPYHEQRALAAEQVAFVSAVVADRPLAVLTSTLAATGRQFQAVGLAEFNVSPTEARIFAKKLPAGPRAEMLTSGALRNVLPTRAVTLLMALWAVAGLSITAIALCYRATRPAAAFGIILTGGWLADVVVCGALSTPHDRYQARVLWVFALAAITLTPLVWRQLRPRSAQV